MSCLLPTTPLSLTAAFAAGVASSLHCVTMCGGIAGALSRRLPRPAVGIGLQQIGRVAGYSAFGALVGAMGGVVSKLALLAHVSVLMRLAAAMAVVFFGLQLLFGWRTPRVIEQTGLKLWRRVTPHLRTLPTGAFGSLGLGLAWALMPCGLVYSMLSIAALSASAASGAALMALFGLGTLPAMIGTAMLAGRALGFSSSLPWARAGGALMLTFGLWTATAVLAP